MLYFFTYIWRPHVIYFAKCNLQYFLLSLFPISPEPYCTGRSCLNFIFTPAIQHDTWQAQCCGSKYIIFEKESEPLHTYTTSVWKKL